MIRKRERESKRESEERKEKKDREKERKLSLFQRFKTNHTIYTYIYIYFIYIYNIYMYINSYSACKNCSDFQNPITKSTPVTRMVCWFGLGLSGLKHDLHLSGFRVVWLRAAALVHQPLLIGMDPSKRRSTSRLPNLHFSFLSLPRWEAGAKSFHQPAVHD